MPLHLYTGIITHMDTHKQDKAYTHAYSHKDALRNFCIRYSYPPYLISEITDTVTKVVMTGEEEF